MLLSERFVARPRLALLARAHRRVQCSSVPPEPAAGEPAAGEEPSTEEPERRRRRRQADSSDPIASFLSRRFGLAGGLAWLGILTFGVVSEQLKTRGEAGREREGTRDVAVADQVERTAPSGLGVTELRLGGGESTPRAGDLLALSLRVEDASTGELLFDSAAGGRTLAILFGTQLTGALCPGVVEGLSGMRAGGVRRLRVPPGLGFPAGKRFPLGEAAPGATLLYTVSLERVSPPPS